MFALHAQCVLSLATNFELYIDGVELSCARISAVELASDPSQLDRRKEPDARTGVLWHAPRLPGRIVVARAIDGDRTLYDWRREAASGKPAVRTLEIHHLKRPNPDAESLHVWQLTHVWPLRWTGPRYDALHEAIAFEEIELVYADLLWLAPNGTQE